MSCELKKKKIRHRILNQFPRILKKTIISMKNGYNSRDEGPVDMTLFFFFIPALGGGVVIETNKNCSETYHQHMLISCLYTINSMYICG